MSQQYLRAMPATQQSLSGPIVFGYVSRKDNMEYFDHTISQLEEEGKIPDLSMKYEYTIYRWKAGFARHESVVVGFQGKFFTLEVRLMEKILTLYTTAENINESKLKTLGTKIVSGFQLIAKAAEVYNDTKSFNFATNNCQDFVNNFLTAIDMVDQVTNTDGDWLFKIGSVAVLGMAALMGFAAMKNNRRHLN